MTEVEEKAARDFIVQKLKAIKNKLRDIGYRDCNMMIYLSHQVDGGYHYSVYNAYWPDGEDEDQPINFYGDFDDGGESDE